MQNERIVEVLGQIRDWGAIIPLSAVVAGLAWWTSFGKGIIVASVLAVAAFAVCALMAMKLRRPSCVIIGIIPLTALIVTYVYLEYERKSSIYAVFRVREPPDIELGESIGRPYEVQKVITYAHEQAIVLWDASYLYILRPDLKIAKQESDADWGNRDHYADLEWLKKRFKPPKGKLPPFYGVARHWDADEKGWQWIGWLNWFCSYANGGVYIQEYKNGFAIGPFGPAPHVSDGRVYFLKTAKNRGNESSDNTNSAKTNDDDQREWRSVTTSIAAVEADRCVP
ncbi:hypothetical protein IY145_14950 [Methylosinus sp. H3A]|uniref:hypothetical protein n=1 Tax=Methylosinus sp. H3A TaxID=2785786 RepID=UPI0018C1F73B|nr:hypothetical protein [Methylosinus sp. H3A]MBG0810668.1 hypothetical protein [Methylosinus sp. H3A]